MPNTTLEFIPNPYTLHANPHYGEGVYRRRIRLSGQAGKVIAELEDCNHGFRSVVHHDGNKVTDIQAESLRIPFTTCDGAADPIKAIIGMALTSDLSSIFRQANPRANCTHLYDLTVLAIAHCLRGKTDRVYDVAITDEAGTSCDATVHRDGKEILRWRIKQWAINQPDTLAGNSLLKGFSQWASTAFKGEDREAAAVLQKGYFVSKARAYDLEKAKGYPAAFDTHMQGACYSYAPERAKDALRLGTNNRDFTNTPEQLLKFL